MKLYTDIIDKLNLNYFWDVDFSRYNGHPRERLIIERVFNLGSVEEINLVIDFYGRQRVIDVLLQVNYIDPKTLNFIAKLFRIPEKKFRCHKQKLLKNQHWNS